MYSPFQIKTNIAHMSACYRATAKLGPDLVWELGARRGAGQLLESCFNCG